MFVYLGNRKEHAFGYIVRKIFWSYLGLVIVALSGSPSLFAKRAKRTRPKSAFQRKKATITIEIFTYEVGSRRKLISFRGLPSPFGCCHTKFIDDWFVPCAYLS